jgi:membrane-associated phospholipid phosphatase
LSDKYAYVVIIGGSYHVMDVQNAFIVSVTIYTALCVLSLAKSFHHEARPFFVSDLTPTKCWFEYGNPSGHSVTSSALYLTMWNLLCRRYKVSIYMRVLSLVCTLLMIVAIAMSRVYNGVHTYN